MQLHQSGLLGPTLRVIGVVQVRHVHIGDNMKYFPIIATDKQVAFQYFTTLTVGKKTVQKP